MLFCFRVKLHKIKEEFFMYYSCNNCLRHGDGWQFSSNIEEHVTNTVCPQCGSSDVISIENPNKPCSDCEHNGMAPTLCHECQGLSLKVFNQIDKPHFSRMRIEKKKPSIKSPEKVFIKKVAEPEVPKKQSKPLIQNQKKGSQPQTQASFLK